MMTNPTMEESQEVAEQYDIDMADVRAALDEEEVPVLSWRMDIP